VPFVVRHNPTGRLLLVGLTWAVLQLVLVVLVVIAVSGGGDDGERSHRSTIFNFVVISVVLLSVLGNPLAVLLNRNEPLLALGPAGLWMRTKPVFGRAIWLPWESLLLISRRRYGFDKMLMVRVRDERIAPLTQPRTTFYRARRPSGFMATLNMADRSQDDILQAVAYFSANRVPLT
jgi:hypothetical protein